jgi:pimeloyl-ACP methyl ester carboxylesterase
MAVELNVNEQLHIALQRLPARLQRVGSLVYNPGGPGASAIDYFPSLIEAVGDEVLDRYDLIAMDPRGVGHSDPIVCHSTLQQLFAGDPSPDDESEWQALDALSKQFADECANRYSQVRLASLGSSKVARDLDTLRQRLAEPKLNFLGFSYGAALGTRYAELAPDKVGKLVLDGPIDLSLNTLDNTLQQAKGFEAALAHYFAWCTEDRCPWANGNPQLAFGALLAQVEAAPLPSPDADRPCGPGEFIQGVLTFLYAGEAGWEILSDDLLTASQGDGSQLVIDTDIYLERDPDTGEYSNITEANYAVNCSDDRALTVSQIRAQESAFRAAAPNFGVPLLSRLLVCAHWPSSGEAPAAPSAVQSAPILLLGTRNDPATPYAWAQATAQQFGSAAHLFTFNGEGHTAYARHISCVDQVVEAYLVDGTLPAADASCGDALPFLKGAPKLVRKPALRR